MTKRQNNILFTLAIVIILVVTGWALYRYHGRSGSVKKEVAEKAATQDFIQEKNLSDHPAMFYEEVGE